MRSPPAIAFNDALHRVLKRISVSSYFTVSACLHTVLLFMIGGMVLNRVAPSPPDFEAGAGGTLVEPLEEAPPQMPLFATASDSALPPSPPMLAPPLSALMTSSQTMRTWKVAVIPSAPVMGPSGSMKDKLASLGARIAQSAGRNTAVANEAAMGSTGGTRWAMIFGKRIVASRLGVILDVSVSGHSRLAGAVTEIQNGFPDATIILYPGCGMMQVVGASDCVIRPYSAISPQEIATESGMFTTRTDLANALQIDSFKKMTARPALKNTLLVAWYGGPGKENSKNKLIGQTQVAFGELLKRGVDTIYWYADFVDAVDPRVIDPLRAELQSRRIVVHVHGFAGEVNQEAADLAIKSGGTVNLEKTY